MRVCNVCWVVLSVIRQILTNVFPALKAIMIMTLIRTSQNVILAQQDAKNVTLQLSVLLAGEGID